MRYLKAFSITAFCCLLATSVEISTGLKTGFNPIADVEARGARGGHRSGHHRARHRRVHRSVRHRAHRRHYVRTLPRGCRTVITANVTYNYCGGVYYRPYYEGTSVVYVVVDAP